MSSPVQKSLRASSRAHLAPDALSRLEEAAHRSFPSYQDRHLLHDPTWGAPAGPRRVEVRRSSDNHPHEPPGEVSTTEDSEGDMHDGSTASHESYPNINDIDIDENDLHGEKDFVKEEGAQLNNAPQAPESVAPRPHDQWADGDPLRPSWIKPQSEELPQEYRDGACRGCGGMLLRPRMLDCLHTFCQSCIESIATSGRARCLVCDHCTDLTSGKEAALKLPYDLLAERRAREAQVRKKACDNCGDGSVAVYCFNCTASMCMGCFSRSHAEKIMKNHRTVEVSELTQPTGGGSGGDGTVVTAPPPACRRHGTEPLSAHCTDCDVLVCNLCQSETGEHFGHTVVGTEDAAGRFGKDMTDWMREVAQRRSGIASAKDEVQNMLDLIVNSFQQSYSSINEEFDAAIHALNTRRGEVLREVTNIAERKSQQLIAQDEAMVSTVGQLSHAYDVAELYLKEATPTELLLAKNLIMSRFHTLDKTICPLLPVDDCLFYTSFDETVLPSCNTYGYVGDRPRQLEFTHSYDGDENGVLFYLGTHEGRRSTYIKPSLLGHVDVSSSGVVAGDVTDVLSRREDAHIVFAPSKKVWLQLDFGRRRLVPLAYSLRENHRLPSMRHWLFQASNDGQVWVTLRRHYNDKSLGVHSHLRTWLVRADESSLGQADTGMNLTNEVDPARVISEDGEEYDDIAEAEPPESAPSYGTQAGFLKALGRIVNSAEGRDSKGFGEVVRQMQTDMKSQGTADNNAGWGLLLEELLAILGRLVQDPAAVAEEIQANDSIYKLSDRAVGLACMEEDDADVRESTVVPLIHGRFEALSRAVIRRANGGIVDEAMESIGFRYIRVVATRLRSDPVHQQSPLNVTGIEIYGSLIASQNRVFDGGEPEHEFSAEKRRFWAERKALVKFLSKRHRRLRHSALTWWRIWMAIRQHDRAKGDGAGKEKEYDNTDTELRRDLEQLRRENEELKKMASEAADKPAPLPEQAMSPDLRGRPRTRGNMAQGSKDGPPWRKKAQTKSTVPSATKGAARPKTADGAERRQASASRERGSTSATRRNNEKLQQEDGRPRWNSSVRLESPAPAGMTSKRLDVGRMQVVPTVMGLMTMAKIDEPLIPGVDAHSDLEKWKKEKKEKADKKMVDDQKLKKARAERDRKKREDRAAQLREQQEREIERKLKARKSEDAAPNADETPRKNTTKSPKGKVKDPDGPGKGDADQEVEASDSKGAQGGQVQGGENDGGAEGALLPEEMGHGAEKNEGPGDKHSKDSLENEDRGAKGLEDEPPLTGRQWTASSPVKKQRGDEPAGRQWTEPPAKKDGNSSDPVTKDDAEMGRLWIEGSGSPHKKDKKAQDAIGDPKESDKNPHADAEVPPGHAGGEKGGEQEGAGEDDLQFEADEDAGVQAAVVPPPGNAPTPAAEPSAKDGGDKCEDAVPVTKGNVAAPPETREAKSVRRQPRVPSKSPAAEGRIRPQKKSSKSPASRNPRGKSVGPSTSKSPASRGVTRKPSAVKAVDKRSATAAKPEHEAAGAPGELANTRTRQWVAAAADNHKPSEAASVDSAPKPWENNSNPEAPEPDAGAATPRKALADVGAINSTRDRLRAKRGENATKAPGKREWSPPPAPRQRPQTARAGARGGTEKAAEDKERREIKAVEDALAFSKSRKNVGPNIPPMKSTSRNRPKSAGPGTKAPR